MSAMRELYTCVYLFMNTVYVPRDMNLSFTNVRGRELALDNAIACLAT